MNDKTIFRPLALAAVLAVIVFAAYLFTKPGLEPAPIGTDQPDSTVGQLYDNPSLGIRFSYPENYVLAEHDADGSALRYHHVIVLMDKTAAATVPVNGEGPTSITIDVFGNAQDKQSVEQWIKNSNVSNFKLSPDQSLSTTTVADTLAYVYSWDGLYRGESTVFEHKDNIVMMSVTTMGQDDPIRSDFAEILRTLELR